MTTSERVKSYFRIKARQIATLADLPICEHPCLTGSHREELQRLYFREILPSRYAVGRGMVYGFSGRSKEADIVIWDSLDYPSLPLADHAFYFSESVRCVIECKSAYSQDALDDVLAKSEAIMGIFTYPANGLREELASIRDEICSLKNGIAHDGIMDVPTSIATAAVFLSGGKTFSEKVMEPFKLEIHEKWPDLMLFLEPGYVIVKHLDAAGGINGMGKLEFYNLSQDALLLFTHELLIRVTERTDTIHSPLGLLDYVLPVNRKLEPTWEFQFPIVMAVPQRTTLWEDGGHNIGKQIE